MNKQPEQTINELLETKIVSYLYLKKFADSIVAYTFAPTVLATLKSERAAYQGESFAFIDNCIIA